VDYLSELDRRGCSLQRDSLLELLARHQVEMSVLLRGVDGFGVQHEIHTDRFVEQAYDLPLVLMAVDVRRSIERVLPELREIVSSRAVTLGRSRLLRGKIERLELAEDPTEATKLTVFLGRDERVGAMPAYRTVVDRLHAQ
jgi:PII-like signaling protein